MSATIVRSGPVVAPAARFTPLESLSRKLLFGALSRLEAGRVRIEARDGAREFGRDAADGLRACVRIHDPRAYAAFALGGSVGAGEAYTEGWWDSEDVASVIRVLVRNLDALDQIDKSALSMLSAPARRLGYWLDRNTRKGSRRNIAAHYDLSNEFFGLWLDPTMTYSCGIFEPAGATLKEASIEKLDRACRKLRLTPTDHLLEIGTGWGSMSMRAAERYGCRVTTTTISRNQALLARERIAAAGLADRITVLETDYRDLAGQYDKVVSIEMIEAVGHDHHEDYFRTCSRLLKPDGLMLLQAITLRDQRYARAAKTRDWLKEHIFPGSCLLSTERIAQCVRRATDMAIAHLEDLGPHYATTLAKWRENFDARIEDVRALGFDERFCRTWRYYFSYCEGVFAERHAGDVQVLLAKPRNQDPVYVERGA
jgi:cyclopropane-fatty-acyl-phospholipid synthase